MRNDVNYRYQELKGDGENSGPEMLLSLRELRVRVGYSCPRYPLKALNHMIALAHAGLTTAAFGSPVELLQWNADKTALEYQARVWAVAAFKGVCRVL